MSSISEDDKLVSSFGDGTAVASGIAGAGVVSGVGGAGVVSAGIGVARLASACVGGDGFMSSVGAGDKLVSSFDDGIVSAGGVGGGAGEVSGIGGAREVSGIGGVNRAVPAGIEGAGVCDTGGVGVSDIEGATVGSSQLLFQTSAGELASSVGTVLLPSKENEDLQQFASEHRSGLAITDDQKLFIAAAWVSKQELRQFLLYPEVLHVDATADTNKEKYPLITITGRDTASTMFTVMRALVPNERAWVFRWLFSVAIPELLGPHATKCIKLIITDGDSQETSQLDVALKEHFPGAVHGRCGWHIVDHGWITKGPKVTHAACSASAFRTYAATFKAWLYSWMSPAVHTKEEYNISKALFHFYVRTPKVIHDLGEANVRVLVKFVWDHVEPHEQYYCHYLKKVLMGMYVIFVPFLTCSHMAVVSIFCLESVFVTIIPATILHMRELMLV
jgi:hypothetical protein